MKGARNFLQGAALVSCALLLVAGCQPNAPVAPTLAKVTPSVIHTDVAGLSKIIALPHRPIAATWQQTQIGDGEMGPSDLQLVAVMEFSPSDARKIEASARKHSAAQGVEELLVKSWFPATVYQAGVRASDGRVTLHGQKWNPDDFGKMSLTHGFVMRVGKTNFLVLSLHTN